MIVNTYNNKKIYICDVCGKETKYFSEFLLTWDHGCEDPCFFCGDRAEGKLGDLLEEDESDEKRDVLWYALSQSEIHTCEHCRNENFDNKDNFTSVFENKLRESRANILLDLIKHKKLPEFSENKDKDEKDALLKEWENLKEEAKELLKRIRDNSTRGLRLSVHLESWNRIIKKAKDLAPKINKSIIEIEYLDTEV